MSGSCHNRLCARHSGNREERVLKSPLDIRDSFPGIENDLCRWCCRGEAAGATEGGVHTQLMDRWDVGYHMVGLRAGWRFGVKDRGTEERQEMKPECRAGVAIDMQVDLADSHVFLWERLPPGLKLC